ncbi:MAG TPA: hypothetical protein ENH51_04455 [Euryarchaeota archaeon]|nr:hypothetical protein [Euryarchaeota archaeon]
MNKKYLHLLLLLIVMGASFAWFVPKYGLIYDGGLYAGIGYSLQDRGAYEFNALPGDVPPVYPVVLAFFIKIFGEKGIFLATPILSAVFIVAVYFLFARELDLDLAFLGALLVFFNQPIYFYTMQLVRDIPLMTFVTLAYLIYFEEKQTPRRDAAMGVFIALAFLTKYAAGVYLIPIFVHSAARRRNMKIPILSAVAVTVPWALWSQITFATPLVSHSSYLTAGMGDGVRLFFEKIYPLFVKWSYRPLLLLSIPGIILALKKDRLHPLAMLFFATLAIGVGWPEKDIRYILFAFVLVVYFALIFLKRFPKAVVILILLFVLFTQAKASYHLVDANTYQNLMFEDAGHWLRDNTPKDARVLAHSYRQIGYYSHRLTYQPPPDEQRLDSYIQYYNTTYAVVDTYEKYTPSYVYTALDRYKPLRVFQNRGNEVRIYDLSEPSKLTVILTFDFESPRGAPYIRPIMDVLDGYNARATFFSTGKMAKRNPELLWEMDHRGFEVGSHGLNHEFPIFRKEDAELFAELFHKSFDYEWKRSAKTPEAYEAALLESREWIYNATGSYPRSYRSPILTPSYTKDMSYLSVVGKVGFSVDSSLSERYIDFDLAEAQGNITIVPATISDSEIGDLEYAVAMARAQAARGKPFVIFFHPWRFREAAHMKQFKAMLDEFELRFENVEYHSIGGYADSKTRG